MCCCGQLRMHSTTRPGSGSNLRTSSSSASRASGRSKSSEPGDGSRRRADIADRALTAGLDPLPITVAHAREAGRLPLHHRDPFDRMLVAQARLESLTLATADATLSHYDVALLTVSRVG